MGKKEVLLPTKATSAEERLEELVKNKTLLKCRLLTNVKDYSLYITNGEFRLYPDGFETIGSEGEGAGGVLYSRSKNMLFFYAHRADNEIQNTPKEK